MAGRNKIWAVCIVAILLATASLRAQHPPPPAGGNSKPSSSSKHGLGQHHNQEQHAGSWLRKLQKVPPAEQERTLNNDPDFKALPADRQEKLRQRLRDFNNLPSEKRQRILKRMEVFDHLTPEQQQKARDLFGRLREMPDDRRRVIKRTANNLRQFDAAERERVLNSEPYRGSFTDEERSLIRELAELDLPGAMDEHRSEQQQQGPQ